jgi:hypothetical protein
VIFKLIHLGDDPGGPAGPSVIGFAMDTGENVIAHRHWGNKQLLIVCVPRSSGEVIEDLNDIPGDLIIARKQATVRIQIGCPGMVISSSDVGICTKCAALSANNQ